MRRLFIIAFGLICKIAYAADRCDQQFPPSLKFAVAREFPAFRLPLSSDNLEEDVQWNIKSGGSGCLGAARGDFDGDGNGDLIVSLTDRNGPGAIVVVALSRNEGWRLYKLSEWSEGRNRLYVEADKAGTYTRTEALEGPLEAGEISPMVCPNSVAVFGATESTGVAYCYEKGQWKHVWISD